MLKIILSYKGRGLAPLNFILKTAALFDRRASLIIHFLEMKNISWKF